MQLTAEQHHIIQHTSKHAKVVAVAGSGKTATLTHFVQQRLQDGVDPRRMLILMYNTAAQQAFSERLQGLCGNTQQAPEIRTFHSLGYKIYHRLIAQGELPPINTKPLSKFEIDLKLKQILEQKAPDGLKTDVRDRAQEWVDLAQRLITFVKSDLNSVETTFKKLCLAKEHRFLLKVVALFEQWRKQQGRISYDDMLYDPITLFHSKPELAKQFANKVDWILVDEYQDINAIQHYLLDVLSGDRAQVMAIGDPDQTIYEFRGSDTQFILNQFQQDFAPCQQYALSHTFRFGPTLALAANNLIAHNKQRDPILTVSADTTPPTQVKVSECADYGKKICSTIQYLQAKNMPLTNIAVLCRLWSFGRPVELHLLANGIPYTMEGGQSIFDCKEIQPFVTLLMMAGKQFFELDRAEQQHRLFQLLATPSPKVGHATLKEITQNWVDLLSPNAPHKSLIKAASLTKNPYHKTKMGEIAKALQYALKKKPASAILSVYANMRNVSENVQSLALDKQQGREQAGAIDAFNSYIAKLDEQHPTAVLTHLENLKTQSQQSNLNGVTLTTVHRSKGLEWPIVFIPSLTENHMPYLDKKELDGDITSVQSERRLMYVAMTRAKNHLFITVPQKSNDTKDGPKPSRFLSEMRLEECSALSNAIADKATEITLPYPPSEVSLAYTARFLPDPDIKVLEKTPPSVNTEAEATWQTGQAVSHAQFGRGKIIHIDTQRIHIQFSSGMQKIFSARSARGFLESA